MDKHTAGQILTSLEATANDVEALAKAGKISAAVAAELVGNIDSFSDRLEIASFGEEAFKARRAKVIQRDPDEKFMDTFDNPVKPIEVEKDEPFMHSTSPSFNSKAIKTYDADPTSQVSERDEFAVRDLSEWADSTKQQPSWLKGPAGKSTKQGSTQTWSR